MARITPKHPKTTTTPVPQTTTTRKPPTTTTAKPPKPAPEIGDPTGMIGGPLKIAWGRGGPWATVNQHDPSFVKYGNKYGVPPSMLKAMEVIESGGAMIPNANGFPNWGNMQLTSRDFGAGYTTPWDEIAKKIGADIHTAEGQIAIAAYALGGHHTWQGTPEDIFLQGYYPIEGGLDVRGPDGHTQREYLNDMHELMRQIDAAAGHGTKTTTTPAPRQGDVLDLLFGGQPYYISAGYGQLVTWSCPNCYQYFTAYGLDSAHHWAYDAVANSGDGAPLYAPFDGTVVCAGTGVGSGSWGTGCAAFDHDDNYAGRPAGVGKGRLELLHKDGDRSLILGHVLSSSVHAGDRVHTGDLIGKQGGMNASHVHVEGRYANGTRIGDPRKLFGGGPIPVTYAPRVPIPQPSEWETGENVTIAVDGVKLLQRASANAAEVDSPFAKGDDFEAVMLVFSEDEKTWYWVSRVGTRVPIAGTTSALLGSR